MAYDVKVDYTARKSELEKQLAAEEYALITGEEYTA